MSITNQRKARVKIRIKRKVCPECKGEGALDGLGCFKDKRVICFRCGGAGRECPHGHQSWRHCTQCNGF